MSEPKGVKADDVNTTFNNGVQDASPGKSAA